MWHVLPARMMLKYQYVATVWLFGDGHLICYRRVCGRPHGIICHPGIILVDHAPAKSQRQAPDDDDDDDED